MRNFFLGCAMWAYKDWVGELFPPRSRAADFLRLYSQRLTTVEGNTTFYATPNPETVQRWVAETPPDFRFCFKLPREVSHSGALEAQLEVALAFVARLAPLGERLGPFFLQVPPGYSPHRYGDLARFLARWPKEYQLAVELRHPDWYAPSGEAQAMELLERTAMGRVVMDVRPIKIGAASGADALLDQARERKPDVPMHPLRSGGFAMIRYIGNPDLDLNAPFLAEWSARISAWLREGTTVYWFMHCPEESRSPRLCRTFQRQLASLGAVPPLPWADEEPPVEQISLF